MTYNFKPGDRVWHGHRHAVLVLQYCYSDYAQAYYLNDNSTCIIDYRNVVLITPLMEELL